MSDNDHTESKSVVVPTHEKQSGEVKHSSSPSSSSSSYDAEVLGWVVVGMLFLSPEKLSAVVKLYFALSGRSSSGDSEVPDWVVALVLISFFHEKLSEEIKAAFAPSSSSSGSGVLT